MRVLAISGSLRRGSYNAALLRAAADEAPSGIEVVVFDRLKEIPPYDEDDDGPVRPAAVAELNSAIASADAVLIATPEYNASIPGVLKNALDWVSRPIATNAMRGKPVVVVGTSTGMFGAIWAQAELRKVLQTMGAEVLDEELPVILAHDRFESGTLVDDDVREALRDRMYELVDMAGRQLAANAA